MVLPSDSDSYAVGILTIPLELLLRIISFHLPEPPKGNCFRVYRQEVMLPSHICQRLRSVALSTPVLWSDIWMPIVYKKSDVALMKFGIIHLCMVIRLSLRLAPGPLKNC